MKLWLNDAEFEMQTAGNGWHNATKPTSAGDRYGFILDDGTRVADPALTSRTKARSALPYRQP